MTHAKKTAATLLLMLAAPIAAGAQDAQPVAQAPSTTAPSAGPAAPVAAGDPRIAFWGGEPGRPFEEYDRLGYPVHYTSAISGKGIRDLRKALAGRVTTATVFPSMSKNSTL